MPRLLAEVIWETDALFPIEAIVANIDEEDRIFVNICDDSFPNEDLFQIAWDYDGTKLRNPLVDSTQYRVGDPVLLLHKNETYGTYHGCIVLVVKMDKIEQ